MAQRWHDLLFAHWPVAPDLLRSLVPAALDLDTFEGRAWVGVVPFRMSGVRPRFLPSVPWLSAFLELNVRTYVCAEDAGVPKPGVFFWSLDAANPIAVAIARQWYRLPYYRARMSLSYTGDEMRYHSQRTHRDAPAAEFHARYRPAGPVFQAAKGSLEHWLTERYCLYAQARDGRIYRGDIHHPPWPLQTAEAHIDVNSMAEAAGVTLPPTPPLLHFARRQDVVVWPLTSVQADGGHRRT